jgi:hypothetical protein
MAFDSVAAAPKMKPMMPRFAGLAKAGAGHASGGQDMRRFYMAAAAAILAGSIAGLPRPVAAQGIAPIASPKGDDRPTRHEVWDIPLGAKIADIADDYIDYACGTNGGPPSTALTGFKDFRRCRPEASGLREVYFRYDDELEYWAKANNF